MSMPYFPQNLPEFNYLRHLMLLYGNAENPWTVDHLKYYVAHFDAAGKPDDWLYDSFLFLNTKAGSGRDFCADVNLGTTMSGEGDFFAVCSPQPANEKDWNELLEFYFGQSGALATLDGAVDYCLKNIGRPYGPRRNVCLMLPYSHVTQTAFGSLTPGGASLDFSVDRQNLQKATHARLDAERWIVDEIDRRWRSQSFRHIHLLGVYWMFETMYRAWNVDDHWLIKELRKHIHAHGLKFIWIPFWSSYNVHLLDNYQDYYFDVAFLQPNYMFYREGRSLQQAAQAARQRKVGIELEYYLELNEPIKIVGERHTRFRDYLNGGVVYRYMNEAACTHFQGIGSLERMFHDEGPVEREFYEDIYHFVKGDYQLKLPHPTKEIRLVRER